MNTCKAYAESELNFSPDQAEDAFSFDDYTVPQDLCCAYWEYLEGCTEPLCEGEGPSQPNTLAHSSHDAIAVAGAETSESTHFPLSELSTEYLRAHHSSAMKSEIVTATTPPVPVPDFYGLTVRPNGACNYETKYKLWYKSFCHGTFENSGIFYNNELKYTKNYISIVQ